ncbi:hypothetical protein GWK47_001700 [Chionoecetes opilio]|uniref:Uncharacterized protein n=1 Tax=Chionoecetes opilio TaxID=41210 RepID=A0A8J4XVI8_CHIOP|nr:hypothetical protein GWK47_001700 [Chionoecetes opilio]
MGLKRVEQKGAQFYMYFNVSSIGGDKVLKVVILDKENTSMLKVTESHGDLQRWCVKVGRTAEEYFRQLCEAVAREDDHVGVFEVQDGHLVWKQYFPEKEIYGKKGKFKMEKVRYGEAVEQVLAGVMTDLHDSSRQVLQLTRETQKTTRKLDEALELATRSVQMKEDLEREIYSKCAALINAKKLRIHQLRSTHPSSSAGRTSCLTRANDEPDPGTSAKKPKLQDGHSDGYSSDTDVDDPDQEMDTDEERAVTLPAKPRKGTATARSPKPSEGQATLKTKEVMLDSQELFNASLEAELYGPSTTVVQRSADSTVPQVKPAPQVKLAPQSPPQLTRSRAAEPVTPSPSVTPAKYDYDEDTQMSILHDLF